MLRVFKRPRRWTWDRGILSAYGPAAGAAALSDLTRILPAAGVAATAGAALLGPAVTTYTAVLLCDTAVPAWHEAHREMPYVFAASAASAAAGSGLLAAPAREAEPARRLAIIGAAVELTPKKLLQRRLQVRAGRTRRGGGCTTARRRDPDRLRPGRGRPGPARPGRFGRERPRAARGLRPHPVRHLRGGAHSARYPWYTTVPQRERLAGPEAGQGPGRRGRGTDRPPVTQKNRAAREGQESGRRRIRWRKGSPGWGR